MKAGDHGGGGGLLDAASRPTAVYWRLPALTERSVSGTSTRASPSTDGSPALPGCSIKYARTSHSAYFSPDGKTIAAGDTSEAVYVWEATSGKFLRAPIKTPADLSGSRDPGNHGSRIQLGRREAGRGARDERHGLFAERPTVVHRRRRQTTGTLPLIAFSPDGSLLATGGGTGEVRFWDADSGARNGRSLTANAGWVENVAFDPSGRILVTSGSDGTTRLIDVAGRVILGASLTGIDNVHEDAAFTPDGKRVIVMSDHGDGFAVGGHARQMGAAGVRRRWAGPRAATSGTSFF